MANMWKASITLAMLAATATGGCRGHVVPENAIPPELQGVPPEVLQNGEGIKLLDIVDIGRLVGTINVEACQKLPTDPQANEAYALALLKQEAARLKADGLVKVSYEPGINPACIASMKGSAIAVRTP
jgi:hypothetical protein